MESSVLDVEKSTAGSESSADPVADDGRRIVAADAAIDAADQGMLGVDPVRRRLLKATYDGLADLIDALHVSIASRRATTLEGAMVQVMVGLSEAQRAVALVPEASISPEIDRHMARAEACLYSVLGILTLVTGADPAQFGGDLYMPARLDPLAVFASLAPITGA